MNELFSLQELKGFFLKEEQVNEILDNMQEVFMRHRTYEYEYINYQDGKERVVFGDPNTQLRIPAQFGKFPFFANDTKIKLQMIPFYEEFVEAVGELATNLPKLMLFCYMVGKWKEEFYEEDDVLPWFREFLEKGFIKIYSFGYERYQNRYFQMQEIIRLLPQLFEEKECFFVARKFQRTILSLLGEEQLGISFISGELVRYPINHKCIGYFRSMLRRYACNNDELFRIWFLEQYHQEQCCLGKPITDGLTLEEYIQAVEQNVITKEILIDKFFHYESQELLATDIRMLTAPNQYEKGKQLHDKYPWLKEVVKQVVHKMVEIELGRGEEPTSFSMVLCTIPRLEGSCYLFQFLEVLGKEIIFRGDEYSTGLTKKRVFSQLLKSCYPTKEDTKELFLELVQKYKIKEKRLVEVAICMPQWANLIEESLNWKGLVSGIWFFHAHINETFSTEKIIKVAKFSKVTPQQFQDGVFDKNWFWSIYEALGEERFQLLYRFAKYITSGNKHHLRVKLYCDAVLGKLDITQLEEEIVKKRNQEKLRAYALIPIKENKEEEVKRRYQFLQQFLEESTSFGAKRRKSEKKAVEVAVENLAINLGDNDMIYKLKNE